MQINERDEYLVGTEVDWMDRMLGGVKNWYHS